MSQLQTSTVVPSRPQPNVYTVLAFIAVVALLVGLVVVLNNLMAPVGENGGYGLTFESLFKPFEPPTIK
jgi:hypothetical protein